MRMTHPRAGAFFRGRTGLALSAALLVSAAAVLAPPAVAGVAETPNACAFSYDGEYRTQGVEVTASAPAAAAAGQAFTLTGEELEVKLRTELARDAAAVGLIPSDGSQVAVATKTWFAIKGTNTREGTQVVGPVAVTATTSALYDESSQTISAQPFVYTPPKLPDTTWTGTGGEIVFSQAGGDAITAAKGQLPVGGGGSNLAVRGSAVVQANLPGGANFYMDCQPGQTNVTRPEAGAGTSFNPLVAAPFAGVQVAGEATNPGGTPPPGSGGGPNGPAGTTLVARRGRLDRPDGEGRTGRRTDPLRAGRRGLRGERHVAHARQGQARHAQGEGHHARQERPLRDRRRQGQDRDAEARPRRQAARGPQPHAEGHAHAQAVHGQGGHAQPHPAPADRPLKRRKAPGRPRHAVWRGFAGARFGLLGSTRWSCVYRGAEI